MPPTAKKAAAEETKPAAKVEEAKRYSDCAVNNRHCVGRAVNGKVCSAHAVSHKSDGTRR